MSELPESWVQTTLGQVVNYAHNETVDPAEMQPEAWLLELEDIECDTGKVLERKTVGARAPKSTKNRFYAGDVLYGKLRPYLNKVVRADKDWFCSSEIIAISPGPIDANYLFYSMRAPCFIEYVSSVSHGMRMPRLGTQQAKEAPFTLPPAAEQTRIAAKLDELLAQVDTLKARIDGIPALLKRFRQSVLAAAVSGRLTEEWRSMSPERRAEQTIKTLKAARPAKEQEHTPVFFEELPHIPENWEWASLGFLVSPDEALCYGVVQPGTDDPDGVYLIRAGDLKSGSVDTSQLRKISVDTHNEYRRSQVKGGEILVTVVGAGIGETAIIPAECAGFNIARAVAKLPIREVSAKYVYLWLSTSLALSWMKGSSREVARPTLNLEQLRALPVPIPDGSEQTEIVRRVEQLFAFADQLEARVAAAQERIDKLTQSILAKAFRGELVPQDPNDEPASVLLERIKAQRAAAPKAKRGRKAKA